MSAVKQQERDRRKALFEQRQQLNTLNPTRTLCTCRFEIPEPSEAECFPQPMSRQEWKKQLIADSYKICQHRQGLRFLDLSRVGQLAALRRIAPQVIPFVETEFDPFHTEPELLRASDYRELNEIKAHCRSHHMIFMLRFLPDYCSL